MIKKLFIFIGIAALFFSQAAPAFAHVFIEDGNIEVFSHIEPDDDPIAKSSAEFFLLFTDATDQFAPSKCNCLVTIIDSNKKELYREVIFDQSDKDKAEDASFRFTFPDRGIYDLMVKGDPKTPGAFQEFEVHRIIRVERTVAFDQSSTNKNVINGILFGTAFLVIVFLFISESRKSKSKKTAKGFSRTDLIVFIALIAACSFFFHEVHAMDLAGDEHCLEDHPCCATVPAISAAHVAAPQTSSPFEIKLKTQAQEILVSFASYVIKNNSPPFSA